MRLLWLFIIFLVVKHASALVKEDLYSASVKVQSKDITVEERKAITEEAFAGVLQKITGKPETLAIRDVDGYLSQYSYSCLDNQTTLKITFDKNIINQTLMDNNYSFLGEYRPLTLLWPQKNSLEDNQISNLLQEVQVVAKLKGLSMVLPMFDLLDLEIVERQGQGQGLEEDKLIPLIKQAAKRYGADEVILVKSNKLNEVLQTSWQAIISGWTTSTEGENLTAQANIFIDQLMGNFVKRYAGHNMSDKEAVLIKISNVINLEDYVKIENYLQNLTFIKNLQGTNFQAGEVEFELSVQGGMTAIKNAIATSNLLKEIDNYKSSDNLANSNVLYCTLQT